MRKVLLRLAIVTTLLWPQVATAPVAHAQVAQTRTAPAAEIVEARSVARLITPGSVYPGNPVVAVMLDGGDAKSLTIRSEAGELIDTAECFVMRLTPQLAISCAILGLPTTMTPGAYVLEITAADGLRSRPIIVVEREFRREEIALTQSLTELRAGDDPRKVAQALELQAVVAEFNPEALYNPGPFRWPIPLTRRTSLFGDRRTYLYADGERASSIHVGLDLASPTGTPVVASGAGRVQLAGDRIVTGNSVVIEHLPGVFSIYYHMETLTVGEGEFVSSGDQIGTVGATGLATGPHLHWEFRIGGVSVDPEEMIPGLLVDFDR